MIKRFGVIGIFLFFTTQGCSLNLQKLYEDYGTRELKLDADGSAQQLTKMLTTAPPDKTPPLVDPVCFTYPDNQKDESIKVKCKYQRNMAVATLMTASDELCQAHFKTIYGNEASFNILTGTLTNLFTGAATGATGVLAKTTLAALGFFANAERSLGNETVYKNMLVNHVTEKIREVREAKAAAIIPGHSEDSIDKYPLQLALYDVVNYHYTCSFMFGLEKALKEGTTSNIDSRKITLQQEISLVEIQLAKKIDELKKEAMDKDKTKLLESDSQIKDNVDVKRLRDRITVLETTLVELTKAQK